MIITVAEIDQITNGQVTNNEWVGTGVFDALMYAANKNIEIQFNKGRIVGKEYADAYTNVMNTIITQAIQYYLHKDGQDEQAALTYAQRVKIDKETAMLGMDTVMKQSEESKTNDPTFVYKPRYIKETL
jgi:hypothetical protein